MARPQCHIPLIIIIIIIIYETSNLVKIIGLWSSKTFGLGHFFKKIRTNPI
jgi:hypothetical protein